VTGAGGILRRFGPAGPAAALFLVALAAGLLFAAAYPIPPVHDDAAEYLSLAKNVSAGNGFTADGRTPYVYRAPLFPGLLGGWFRVAGSPSPAAYAAFQSAVHAFGVVAAYLLYLEFVAGGWAFAGALFLAINPLLVTRVVLVLQEPVLLLATTLALLASVRWLREPTPGGAALAGVGWGVCILAKPVAWFAPLLLAGAFAVACRRRARRPWIAALLLLCACGATVAPWMLRNLAVFHRIIPVTSQGGSLLAWSVGQTQVPDDPEQARLLADPRLYGDDPAFDARVRRFVMRHPREFLLERTVRNAFFFAAPPRDWWNELGLVRPDRRHPPSWLAPALFHLPLHLLLAWEMLAWLKGRADSRIGFLLLFYMAYWAEHALLWGDPRYGLAVYPLLTGLALHSLARRGAVRAGPYAAGDVPGLREAAR
jgi:4-amino-4-deoxy-L-arabinose transferase-like glycosyltransferase